MSMLLEAMGHLLAAGLEARLSRAVPGARWALREVTLEPDGFRAVLWLGEAGAARECVLRGRIEDEQAGRQRVQLFCERLPERLPEPLAALRPLLETARLTLELDFRGEPAAS
jgi:hypothetical protein